MIVAADSIAVHGAGATFPQKVYEKVFEDYQKKRQGLTMKYIGDGSGKGQKKIKAFYDNSKSESQVIFAGSDSELEELDYVHYPGIQMMPSLAG